MEVEIGNEYLGPDPDGKLVRLRVDRRGNTSDRILIEVRGQRVPSDVAIVTFLQGKHRGSIGRVSYLQLAAMTG